MDAGSELLMIPGTPVYCSDIPLREGIYEGQVINGIVTQVHLTLELLGSQTHLLCGPLVSECIMGMNTVGR